MTSEETRVVMPPTANPTDAPPSYDSVTDSTGPPPSYESLYGEFRQVQSPRGFFDFVRKVAGIIIGTVMAAILIAVVSMIPIAMIVVGSLNLHRCPIEEYIPIYLIVGGVFGLVKSLTNFYYRFRRDPDADPQTNVNPNPFDGIINCFLLAWFIAGSVWVYRAYLPHFDAKPTSAFYCDPVAYYFAFAIITITYLMAVIFLFCLCCCGCIALCCGKE